MKKQRIWCKKRPDVGDHVAMMSGRRGESSRRRWGGVVQSVEDLPRPGWATGVNYDRRDWVQYSVRIDFLSSRGWHGGKTMGEASYIKWNDRMRTARWVSKEDAEAVRKLEAEKVQHLYGDLATSFTRATSSIDSAGAYSTNWATTFTRSDVNDDVF